MKKIILWGLFISVLLVLFISPFASNSPDGLERVAEDKGFIAFAKELFHAPLPDYTIPGLKYEKLSTILSGLLGTILTFGIAVGIASILKKRR